MVGFRSKYAPRPPATPPTQRRSRGRTRRRGSRSVSVVSMLTGSRDQHRTAIRERPDPLRKNVHVRVDGLPLPSRRLARRGAEMQKAENALACSDAGDLPAPRGSKEGGRSPVRGEASLRRGEQHERDRGRRRADVFFVLHELAAQDGGGDNECRRAIELHRFARPAAFLQRRKARRADDAEPPGLRQMMVRREPSDIEQLEQHVVGDGLVPECLVRAPRLGELAQVHARRAETCTSAPARFSSCENGHPSSAFSAAAASPDSSSPSTETTAPTFEPTIWCPWPSTSSMTIVHVTSRWPGGVPAWVSSVARDIVMQPPWAAASSSSGLVFPSAFPIREGRE